MINALTADRKQYRDTIVIYLSDHGEMLGAHGGMFQKWHAAYDEMLRVPFMFHNPELFPTRQSSDILTSHADLIPTMLGLAGLDEARAGQGAARAPTPRCGASSVRTCRATCSARRTRRRFEKSPVYFMTDDQPFKGANAVSMAGLPYQPVDQPNCVETVVAYLPTGPRRRPGAVEVLALLGQPAVLDDAERAGRA